MKTFVIYFANGAVEYTIQKSIKEAKTFAAKRAKDIPMVVLMVYEQNTGAK